MLNKDPFESLGPHTNGKNAVLYPRLVGVAIGVVYSALCCVWLERQFRLTLLDRAAEVASRDHHVPNYYYVNNDRDIFYLKKGRGALNKFGEDFLSVSGNWTLLCAMDSDGDGWTNGRELGDPCCRWKAAPPNTAFSLARRLEYRRWFLTNPGDNNSSWLSPGNYYAEPDNCDDGSEHYMSHYMHQYWTWYYAGVREPAPCGPTQVKHWIGIGFLVMFFSYWFYQGLVWDLLPLTLGITKRSLGVKYLIITGVVSFLYMDFLSGMAHLCLDYSPNWIPLLGPVANSFQQHHRAPALLAASCGKVWLNDAFVIMPLPVILLVGVNPARISRLFWFWGFTYALLFLAAHPWAHMEEDMVPWLVNLAQRWGVLLNQDAHMRHHANLQSQFTILSGHTDVVLDLLTQVVPPHRYDMWLFFFVTWLILPIAMDIKYRSFINRKTLPICSLAEDKFPKV